MMLSLDVDFWLGHYEGTQDPTDGKSDFPPQPDRIFSALFCAYAHCKPPRPDQRDALIWLESQAPPKIWASAFGEMDATPTWVPVNGPDNTLEVLPEQRPRQLRRFQAAIPHDPVMTVVWENAHPDEPILRALHKLAHRTPALGRSRSVARFKFHQNTTLRARHVPYPCKRWVYPGRLEELWRAHKNGELPVPGVSVPPPRPAAVGVPESVFGTDWVVFADAEVAGLPRPSLHQAAQATGALRTAFLRTFRGAPAPEVFTGHRRDGSGAQSDKNRHLAYFPLANVGWPHSNDALMGLAMCLPRDVTAAERKAFATALLRLHEPCRRTDPESLRIVVGLYGHQPWILERQPEPEAKSLQPYRYMGPARSWSTVTPIVLDRFPHARGEGDREREIIEMICRACAHSGLPRPSIVVPHREAAISGVPPVWHAQAYPPRHPTHRSRSELASSTRWQLPERHLGAALTHCTLGFDEPVGGPIALGKSRRSGLGLFLPLEE